MSAALIAVLGTLAGGAMSYLFQSRLATSARQQARQDQRHAALMEACANLGAALIAYRHSQLARRRRTLQGGTYDQSTEVRERRGEAWAAYFRLSLLTADPVVLRHAKDSFSRIRNLKELEDLNQLDADAEEARESVDRFINCAREILMGPVNGESEVDRRT